MNLNQALHFEFAVYHLSLQSGSSCDLAVRPDGVTTGMRPGFISFLA